MNFDYSEEQQMLEASVSKLLAKRDAGQPVDPFRPETIWADYAELGLLGMGFGEADGGLGTGAVETMIVMRAMGKALCTAPYLASAVYGSCLLKAAGSTTHKAELIPGLIDGSIQLAVAHSEPRSRYMLSHIATSARAIDSGFTLSGRKSLVVGGASATHFIVGARTSGDHRDRDGITLFLMPRTTSGIRIASHPTIDGRAVADIVFDAVKVDAKAVLGTIGHAMEVIEEATDHAIVASINEAVGAMEALLSATVDYLKTRRQFGVPIGSFQALQHHAVDMFIEIEQAKSMALYATMQLGLSAAERRNAIASAKLHVNRASRVVGEAAVQLHGAIGMTMESKTGRLFNRLAACQSNFGDSDFWLSVLLKTNPDILAA